MFSVQSLPWSPIDHCELFAGEQSVSRGELEVGRIPNTVECGGFKKSSNGLYWVFGDLFGKSYTHTYLQHVSFQTCVSIMVP